MEDFKIESLDQESERLFKEMGVITNRLDYLARVKAGIIQVTDQHAESSEWFENEGQVEICGGDCIVTKNSNWYVIKDPTFLKGRNYRPFTHGLHKGMVIPSDVLNAWCEIHGEWLKLVNRKMDNKFPEDVEIYLFEIKNGVCVANINGSNYGFTCEGFLEFWDNFNKEEPKELSEWPLSVWLYGEGKRYPFLFKANKEESGLLYSEECVLEGEYFRAGFSEKKDRISRVATKSDIETIMSVVFDKMGYKEGVTIITPVRNGIKRIVNSDIIRYEIFKGEDIICKGGVCVYKDGNFATIVEQPIEQPTEIEMFTQEDYNRIYESLKFHSDGHALDICKKIKPLIEPLPVQPMVAESKRSIYDVKSGDTIFKEEFSGIVDAVFENSLIVIWQNSSNAKLNSKDSLYKNGWEIKK